MCSTRAKLNTVIYLASESLSMKSVYLKGRSRGGPFHSLYRELVEFPPEGYCFVSEKQKSPRPSQSTHGLTRTQQMTKRIDRKLRNFDVVWDIWNRTETMSYILIKRFRDNQFRSLPEAQSDLIYCSQQLLFAELPWVVDVEFANALAGGNEIRVVRRIVKKCLASKHCKKIIPWSNWAKTTLYKSMNCDSFNEKIETVHFGMRTKNTAKKRTDDKIRLLFVGSTNLDHALDFERKGGIEAIKAFLELRKKYDLLELVVRSWVPRKVKTEYANDPNIKIFDSPLTEAALARLYISSDIFLFPSHLNLGMGILEAMSYELPVIARSIFDVPEAVEDMKTGLLLDPLPMLPYYKWNGVPNCFAKEFLPGIRKYRIQLVNQIVEKTALLIENPSLMKKLGRQARASIESGRFSIKNRNMKLKRIFDEASCAS
jgi:glycosyltransferase involved in cell wall biosynthesis